MSDIFQAVKKRTTVDEPKVDIVNLDEAKLFPAPTADQQGEFARLASLLLEYKPRDRGLVLGFASNTPGEGASFVSYNVARLLSLGLGRATTWVDANFLTPQPKLQLRDEGTFAQFLRDPAGARFVGHGMRFNVVPGGLGLGNLKAEMASRFCVQVLESFRDAFDFTILDCPPIQSAVETSLLGSVADGMVVVVEAKRLKHHVVTAGLSSLQSRNVHVFGTVLNKRTFELPKIVYDRL